MVEGIGGQLLPHRDLALEKKTRQSKKNGLHQVRRREGKGKETSLGERPVSFCRGKEEEEKGQVSSRWQGEKGGKLTSFYTPFSRTRRKKKGEKSPIRTPLPSLRRKKGGWVQLFCSKMRRSHMSTIEKKKERGEKRKEQQKNFVVAGRVKGRGGENLPPNLTHRRKAPRMKKKKMSLGVYTSRTRKGTFPSSQAGTTPHREKGGGIRVKKSSK